MLGVSQIEAGDDSAAFTTRGHLRRAAIPQFAKDAIYYR
jgi:hypothetical protein